VADGRKTAVPVEGSSLQGSRFQDAPVEDAAVEDTMAAVPAHKPAHKPKWHTNRSGIQLDCCSIAFILGCSARSVGGHPGLRQITRADILRYQYKTRNLRCVVRWATKFNTKSKLLPVAARMAVFILFS